MRNWLRLYIFLVSLFISQSIWAVEIEHGGKVSVFNSLYFTNKEQGEDVFSEIRFQPYLTLFFSDSVLAHLETDLRLDTAGYTQGYFDDVTSETERRVADIKEGYAEYAKERLRLRVGKQIFDWSVADTVSPSDNLNPRDWTDVIKWERIGIPAVSARYGYDSYCEIVWAPFFNSSIIPKEGWRWQKELARGIIQAEQDLPDRHQGQIAARFGMVWHQTDLSLSYYRGYNFSPTVEFQPTLTREILAVPIYRKLQAYSAGIAKSASGFTFRGEIGYINQRNGDDFTQYVIGVDRIWDAIFQPADSLYLLVQYTDEVETENITSHEIDLLNFRRALSKAVMLKSEYSFNNQETWKLKLEGFYNFRDKDSYFEPAVAYRYDNWETELGLGIASGSNSSFMGGYDQNDRIFLIITRSF